MHWCIFKAIRQREQYGWRAHGTIIYPLRLTTLLIIRTSVFRDHLGSLLFSGKQFYKREKNYVITHLPEVEVMPNCAGEQF